MSHSPAQTRPAARPPGGGHYPPVTLTTWGALTSAQPRHRAPPPEGMCGLAGVKRQGAEPRGGAEPAADRGVIDSPSIIRPPQKNRYRRSFTSSQALNVV